MRHVTMAFLTKISLEQRVIYVYCTKRSIRSAYVPGSDVQRPICWYKPAEQQYLVNCGDFNSWRWVNYNSLFFNRKTPPKIAFRNDNYGCIERSPSTVLKIICERDHTHMFMCLLYSEFIHTLMQIPWYWVKPGTRAAWEAPRAEEPTYQ